LDTFIVYSKNVGYGSPKSEGGYTGDNIFELCKKNITLYGYANSTTMEYAEAQGLAFKDITSLNVEPESISLNIKNLNLKINDTKEISATVMPDNALNKSVIWVSSDESIATVNNGVIKAVGEGTAIISAFTYDKKYEAKCSVTVTKDEKSDGEDIEKTDKDNTNKENDKNTNESKQTSSSSTTVSTNKVKDNTISTSAILPNTGKNIIEVFLGILIIVNVIIVLVLYKKNKYYKNI
jgi:uncharacterized protein YjdB